MLKHCMLTAASGRSSSLSPGDEEIEGLDIVSHEETGYHNL